MSAARLWILYRGSPVRIALEDGESLVLFDGGRHEEGWWRSCDTYAREGDVIVRESSDDGTDCDGRYSFDSRSAVALDCLQEHLFEGVPWPAWQPESASQRDYSAEAAGY